jgi:hypothetical protein
MGNESRPAVNRAAVLVGGRGGQVLMDGRLGGSRLSIFATMDSVMMRRLLGALWQVPGAGVPPALGALKVADPVLTGKSRGNHYRVKPLSRFATGGNNRCWPMPPRGAVCQRAK